MADPGTTEDKVEVELVRIRICDVDAELLVLMMCHGFFLLDFLSSLCFGLQSQDTRES